MDTNIRASRRSLIGALAFLPAATIPAAAIASTSEAAAWDAALSTVNAAWDRAEAFRKTQAYALLKAGTDECEAAEERFGELIAAHDALFGKLLRMPAPTVMAAATKMRLAVERELGLKDDQILVLAGELERLGSRN